MFYT